MAASNTHSITAATMLEVLPFAVGSVTSSSGGLTTDNLTQWIDEAAGTLNSLLQRHSIDPDGISGNTLSLVQTGIRAYVAARALSHRKFPADEVQREWEIWGSVRKTLRESPQDLGDDQAASAQVVSNLPATPTQTRFDAGNDIF